MNCGSRGRWPFLGMSPVVLLLVLCLHLQGSASRCIDTAFGQDLQPLPPSAERCSIPSGLLQPDVSSLGQGGGGGGDTNVGDTRIVGGMPATSGGLADGSSTGFPTSPGGSPFQYGKPGNPSQNGPGPVGIGSPAQYGSNSFGGSSIGIRKNGPRGFPRPEWAPPGIPYIPTARERGGGYIPVQRESPRYLPNPVPLGGGAGSSTYSSGSIASGPRGSDDGSYGPVPEGPQPGGQRGGASGERGPLCNPNC